MDFKGTQTSDGATGYVATPVTPKQRGTLLNGTNQQPEPTNPDGNGGTDESRTKELCPTGKIFSSVLLKCVCSDSAATCAGTTPDFDENTCACVCDKSAHTTSKVGAWNDALCDYEPL